jgi:hypothetical protein
MNARSCCLEHSGICGAVEEVKEKVNSEKNDRVRSEETIWKAIDGMRKMYFLSMTSFLGLCISGIAFLFAKMMHWI